MPKPKPSPLSLRPSDELKARIDAYAQANGKNRHAAAIAALEAGMDVLDGGKGTTPTRKAKKRTTPAKAAKAVLAQAEKRVGVHPATLDPPAQHLDTSMVPFNPPRAPMQKAPAKALGRWKL